MVKIKAKKAISTLQKIKGLIGETSIKPLVITTRFGIHTFGMKLPIDVLILNRRSQVVKLKTNLKPNSLFFWNPLFDRVIELPKGFIAQNKIKMGERISLTDISL